MFAGVFIFLVSVIVDHLHAAGLTPWQLRTEPFGFLANLVCLGYVAVQRFVTNEQQLIAVDKEMMCRQVQGQLTTAAYLFIPVNGAALRTAPRNCQAVAIVVTSVGPGLVPLP